jgi:hypothetical protein
MAASNTRFTQNSLGQSKNPIDSDHGIYRYRDRFFIPASDQPSATPSAGAPWATVVRYRATSTQSSG